MNVKRGTILKPKIHPQGYHQVNLCDSGKCSTKLVHRLVALSFIKNQPSGLEVNHIDGVKANNKVNNLEFVTPSENVKHSYKTGLKKWSPASGCRPKSVVNVDTGEKFSSVSNAARSVGVTKQAVGFGLRTGGLVKGFRFKYAD